MPDPDAYIGQKLEAAIRTLATSAAPLQRRLLTAWAGALGDVPADYFSNRRERGLFEQIRSDVNKLSASEETGSAPLTLDAMRDDDAESVAEMIVELREVVELRLAASRSTD